MVTFPTEGWSPPSCANRLLASMSGVDCGVGGRAQAVSVIVGSNAVTRTAGSHICHRQEGLSAPSHSGPLCFWSPLRPGPGHHEQSEPLSRPAHPKRLRARGRLRGDMRLVVLPGARPSCQAAA